MGSFNRVIRMGSHIFGFFGIRQFYVLRHIGLKISIYYFFGGAVGLLQIRYAFHFCMVLPMCF